MGLLLNWRILFNSLICFFLCLTLSCLVPQLIVEICQHHPSASIHPSFLPSSVHLSICLPPSPPPPTPYPTSGCLFPSSPSPTILCPAQLRTRPVKRATNSFSPRPDSHLISNLLDPAILSFFGSTLWHFCVSLCVCVSSRRVINR